MPSKKRKSRPRRRVLGIILEALVSILPDIIIAAGGVCITAGVAIIHPAAGWIAGGILLVVAGIIGGRGIGQLLQGGKHE